MSLGAASAHAALVELAGSSTFTPSEQAKQFLANNGVAVEPTGPAGRAGTPSASPARRPGWASAADALLARANDG
jgi:hypothetical protein